MFDIEKYCNYKILKHIQFRNIYQNFVVYGVMINLILLLTNGILFPKELYNMWSVDLFHNHSLQLCPFPEFQEIKTYFLNMLSIEELYTFFVFKSLFRSLLFIMLLLEILLCKPFFFVMSFATYCKLTILWKYWRSKANWPTNPYILFVWDTFLIVK